MNLATGGRGRIALLLFYSLFCLFVCCFTHAGTSESVTLDHGCRRSELRRPASAGQAAGAAADHQEVEPGRLRVC